MSGSISRINNSTIDEVSEVAISMSSEESDDYILDQEVCYGQVIYMFKIIY